MRFATLSLALLLASCVTAVAPSPTQPKSTTGCDSQEVSAFLDQADSAITRLNHLATTFGDTESASEAAPIIKDVDDLFLEIMLWEAPPCAKDLQINVAMAVENLSTAMTALMNGDVEEFNRNYGTYAIAVEMMNKERDALLLIAGD